MSGRPAKTPQKLGTRLRAGVLAVWQERSWSAKTERPEVAENRRKTPDFRRANSYPPPPHLGGGDDDDDEGTD